MFTKIVLLLYNLIFNLYQTSDCKSLIRMVSHYNFQDQLNVTDINGSTPIHNAAKKGDVKMLEQLLTFGTIGTKYKFFFFTLIRFSITLLIHNYN